MPIIPAAIQQDIKTVIEQTKTLPPDEATEAFAQLMSQAIINALHSATVVVSTPSGAGTGNLV